MPALAVIAAAVDRSRRAPVPPDTLRSRDHLIVCGDDALAYRVAEELGTNYGERVTVLLGSAERGYVLATRTGRSRVLARGQAVPR